MNERHFNFKIQLANTQPIKTPIILAINAIRISFMRENIFSIHILLKSANSLSLQNQIHYLHSKSFTSTNLYNNNQT